MIVDPVLTGLKLTGSRARMPALRSYERADAINKYLSALPPTAPIRTVEEMIAKGGDLVKPAHHRSREARPLDHNKQLLAAYKQQDMIRAALIELMEKYQLDGVILPYRTVLTDDRPTAPNPRRGGGGNAKARTRSPHTRDCRRSSCPAVSSPSDGMPFAVQFLGKPFTEPTLIKLASGYEAVSKHRKAPASTPPLPGERFSYPERVSSLARQ